MEDVPSSFLYIRVLGRVGVLRCVLVTESEAGVSRRTFPGVILRSTVSLPNIPTRFLSVPSLVVYFRLSVLFP